MGHPANVYRLQVAACDCAGKSEADGSGAVVLYALHDGMNHYSAGEAPPHEMPVIPAVWPDTFPFDIAWSFVEIINARAERFRSQQANGHS